MPDELSVSPEGLLAASAVLGKEASHANGAVASSGEPSSAGAASVAAAVEAFTQAFSHRVVQRGKALRTAAGVYTETDNDASGNIATVEI